MVNRKFPRVTALTMVLILILSSFMLPVRVQALETNSSEAANRVKMNFNTGWLFYKGDIKGAEAFDFDDSYLEAVNLPHTARLEPKDWKGTTPCYQGICWYRRHFTLDQSYSGKKIFIEFQGAMGNADVWINGTKVTTHHGGYTPFTIDITNYVHLNGENVIAVKLDNSYDPETPPGKPQNGLDFCYYGGIYRDVNLLTTDKLHVTDPIYANKIADGGIFVTYPAVSKAEATIEVKTNVKNEYDSEKNCSIKTTIVDAQNNVAATMVSDPHVINAGSDYTFLQTIKIENPKLWHPNNPNLYTMYTSVKDGDNYVDDYKTRIGIRRIEFTPDKGFFINGEGLLLSGVNRHQDYLYIGNAAPNSMQYRDAKLIKDAGFNCVRTGHYPQDPEFLDACDELGITVIETTPGWQYFGDNTFQERAIQNIREEVRRDRNRPSVVLWESSINETRVTEEFAQKAYNATHEEYPGDQCYASADYAAFGKEIYDVNYKEVDTAEKPLFTREWGDEWSEGASDTTGYRSARRYGEVDMINSCISRQRALGGDGYFDWCGTNANPRISGYALWSFNDYNRGTETPIAHSGVVDIDRYPKFNYYFLQSQRDPNIKLNVADSGPMVFIANYWTASSPKDVRVMSNCQQVKLYLNDRVIATNNPDTNVGVVTHPIFTFKNVPWESGTLRAEGLIDGKVVATHNVNTPGAPHHLSIEFATSGKEFVADGSDMVTAYITVRDKDGNIVPTANDSISLSLSGPGILIGNGDPRVKANPVNAEAGIAPVLIKSTLTPGKITLTATIGGLVYGSAELTSIPYNGLLVPGGSDERNNSIKGDNVALNKVVTASSEQSGNPASYANDGDEKTFWSAADATFPQWLKVDLGENYNITGSEVVWNISDTAAKYKIEASKDNNNWITVVDKTQNESTAQRQSNPFAANGRYIRLTILEGGNKPVGVCEFKVFSVLKSDELPPEVDKRVDVASGKIATASSSQTDNGPDLAVDDDPSTMWKASEAAPQWWQVDLGSKYDLSGCKILWGKDSVYYSYRVSVSKDGDTWSEVVKKQATGQNFIPDDFTAQGIRYVRVYIDELAGGVNEYPAMRKVEIYSDRINIAQGKTSISDSEQTQNPASSGNDGSDSTRWCASDGYEGHWWKVDLGDYYDLSGTEVVWEQDGKTYKYKVEVSPDDKNWILKVDKTKNSSKEKIQEDIITASCVRYVRITATGLDNAWASFWEFKVFGSKSEDTSVLNTAAWWANEIKNIGAPTKDATRLNLPQVPEGFTIAIKSSSNTAVITTDGNIIPPVEETHVTLVLEITKISDGTKAQTSEITIVVPAKTKEKPIPNPDSIKIPQSQMSATATSEETIGEYAPASNVLDGDIGTFWHTRWTTHDSLPQSLTINLGGKYMINQLRYLPRQNSLNGRITSYKTYVSMDGITFTEVDMGNWQNDRLEKVSTFIPVNACYVKLEAIEGFGNYASAAEINVYREPDAVIADILQPINADGTSLFKAGSTVPVKFTLKDSSGAYVSTASATISYAKLTDNGFGTDVKAISTSAADTGNEFRYDSTSNQYIFNMSTKGLTAGTYRLTITLDDGKSYPVQINLK